MFKIKKLATITKPLCNHNITYKWGHPVKLVVTKDGKEFNIHSLEEDLTLLCQWNILESQALTSKPPSDHRQDDLDQSAYSHSAPMIT